MNRNNVLQKIASGEKLSLLFLLLTFLLAGNAFILMYTIPTAQKPEGWPGFPIWLLAIYSPSISAFILWGIRGEFKTKVKSLLKIPNFSRILFATFSPMIVLVCILLHFYWLGGVSQESWFVTLRYILPLLLLQLFLGPIGEEFGWRGLLYPEWRERFGWFYASLLVGIVWAFWHAPLWLIDSPQAQIPFVIFFLNVLCFSILISLSVERGEGSIIGAILFHLFANLSVGIVELQQIYSAATYYSYSLYVYVPLVLYFLLCNRKRK